MRSIFGLSSLMLALAIIGMLIKTQWAAIERPARQAPAPAIVTPAPDTATSGQANQQAEQRSNEQANEQTDGQAGEQTRKQAGEQTGERTGHQASAQTRQFQAQYQRTLENALRLRQPDQDTGK